METIILKQDIADKMQVVARAYQDKINAEKWYAEQIIELEKMQAELTIKEA